MTFAAISIIVPLYNKAVYVASTLNALSRQISAIDEIIVVDDCSTDGSNVIAQRYASEHLRVLHREANAGPATARNWGAECARGKFLLFFDADDDPHPNLLAVLRRAISEFPTEAIFCFKIAYGAHGEQYQSEADPVAAECWRSPAILPIDAFAHSALAGKPLCTASSTCVCRSVFIEAGGFLAGLRYCEDPELWARLSSRYRIVKIPVVLANYKDVPESLSQVQRIRIGAVEPYVETLRSLARSGPHVYGLLAFAMLKKNVVFARASGATIGDIRRFIHRNRDGLDSGCVAILRVIGLMPVVLLRFLLHLRSWMLRRRAARRATDAY